MELINKENWIDFLLEKGTLQRRKWLIKGLKTHDLDKILKAIDKALSIKLQAKKDQENSTDQIRSEVLKKLKKLK